MNPFSLLARDKQGCLRPIGICPDTHRVYFQGEGGARHFGVGHGFASFADEADAGEALLKAGTHASPVGPTIRWITVHPHGEHERGFPVRIVENHDKSWTVAGGAKGVLNGLRLTHVKTPHEYRVLAVQRRQARAEERQKAKQEHLESLTQKHREQLHAQNEGLDAPHSPTHIETLARQKAKEEQRELEKQGKDAAGKKRDEAHEHERARIGAAAKAAGWDENKLSVPAEVKQGVRDAAVERALEENPRLRLALQSDNAAIAGRAARRVNEAGDKAVQQVEKRHHQALLSRASAIEEHLSDQIAAAHHAAQGEGDRVLGDADLRDVVAPKSTGDMGVGYRRGLEPVAPNDDESAHRSRVAKERASKARQMVQELDAHLEAHGLAPSQLGELSDAPTAATVGEAAAHLLALKRAKDAADAARQGARTLENQSGAALSDALETLPKTAVVRGEELSDDEATQKVIRDILGKRGEEGRQGALDSLLGSARAQEEKKPLLKHRLAGHNAFWSQLCDATGLQALDPLQADILGASGTAHVLRRALEQKAAREEDKGARERIQAALAEHHVERQVELCQSAVAASNAMLAKADELSSQAPRNPRDNTELLAGAAMLEEAAKCVSKARQTLGHAVGSLEAGAALNEALLGNGRYGNGEGVPDGEAHPHDVQIALGAISRAEALAQVGALGLSSDGETKQYRLLSDGYNQILALHEAGIEALAQGLHLDPREAARRAQLSAIKRGDFDEADYLPPGFSKRTVADVSEQKFVARELPKRALEFDASNLPTGETRAHAELGARLKEHIARCMDDGQTPTAICDTLHSVGFRASHAGHREGAFRAALDEVFPGLSVKEPKRDENGILDGPSVAKQTSDHIQLTNKLAQDYHNEFLTSHPDGPGAVGSQSLWSDDEKQNALVRDTLYQVVLQDPRLSFAFTPIDELGRDGKRALRDYALQKLLGLQKKKGSGPDEDLSSAERALYSGLHGLQEEAAKSGQDLHALIQERWRQADESKAGSRSLFDDEDTPPNCIRLQRWI